MSYFTDLLNGIYSHSELLFEAVTTSSIMVLLFLHTSVFSVDLRISLFFDAPIRWFIEAWEGYSDMA